MTTEQNYIKIDCSKMNSSATAKLAYKIFKVIEEDLGKDDCLIKFEVVAINP